MTTPGTTAEGPVLTEVTRMTCLVELVLSAGEFGPKAEPALRELRAVLEVEPPELAAVGPVLRTGMAVTQEFGKLDITLRALVIAGDLVTGAALGAEPLRRAVAGLAGGGAFREQSLRASWA